MVDMRIKLQEQIKKYEIDSLFDDDKKLVKWFFSLKDREIKNINSLTISPAEILFPKELLINKNLLKCSDYCRRVNAIASLKNGDGCWHLFDRLCSDNFLKSKTFYEDIKIISKAKTARYALWVIADKVFINSPFHTEDLKLIVEAKNQVQNDSILCNPMIGDDAYFCNSMVWEALADVSHNEDSIKSPYHRQDMQIIANCGIRHLHSRYGYPVHGVNNLAVDRVSLNDKFHLENMQLLIDNPHIERFLFSLMTKKKIVDHPYYRELVMALSSAKSPIKALCMYYYILNPSREYRSIDSNMLFGDCFYNSDVEFLDLCFISRNRSVMGIYNSNCLKHLEILNEIDDEYCIYFETLMSNWDLMMSNYQDEDINSLLNVKDKEKLRILYRLMTNNNSLRGSHHQKDVTIISECEDFDTRLLLLKIATCWDNINSINHEFDMDFISRLDVSMFDDEQLKEIYYYLFNPNGINHLEHIFMLERLKAGEIIKESDMVKKDSNDKGNFGFKRFFKNIYKN